MKKSLTIGVVALGISAGFGAMIWYDKQDKKKKEELAYALTQKEKQEKQEQEAFNKAKANFTKNYPDLVRLSKLKNQYIVSNEIDYDAGQVIIQAKIPYSRGQKEVTYWVRKTDNGDYEIEAEGQRYYNSQKPSEDIEEKGMAPATENIVDIISRLCSAATGADKN